ncbi:thioredoxin domain-containing protein [Hoyosella subflava]|uniref:Thioredoxin-like fold domain-containing protein n=1 Tax=Hoyosella subflava (strain DSM 45089 / JCM 17490 / NBRC 109087 / DQS3-9A1) TaxID=443218 RepID=F6EP06_HOYSD|nr:thioredoxin domain-containing protein [Hoyosella subflava]AEF40472.1 hypothetical protein AS9A_2023 [Hoyosella subflava DQS3-9A1]
MAGNEQPRYARLMRFGALAALVLAAITVIIIFARGEETVGEPGSAVGTPHPTTSLEDETPPPGTADGAVRVPLGYAVPASRPVVTIVEDFLCEGCQDFALSYGPVLRELSERGDAAVEFVAVAHPAGPDQSAALRIANSTLCVASDDIANWPAFRAGLYEQLAADADLPLDDATLIETAHVYGASHAVENCVRELRFAEHIRETTERWTADEPAELPVVLINGERHTPVGPGSFAASVRAAGNES